eukprot:753290-Hanusia_phi.AAC.11
MRLKLHWCRDYHGPPYTDLTSGQKQYRSSSCNIEYEEGEFVGGHRKMRGWGCKGFPRGVKGGTHPTGMYTISGTDVTLRMRHEGDSRPRNLIKATRIIESRELGHRDTGDHIVKKGNQGYEDNCKDKDETTTTRCNQEVGEKFSTRMSLGKGEDLKVAAEGK